MNSAPSTQHLPLSTDAQRLLSHLRRCCYARHLAHTDAHIARVTGLPQRDLVTLADELLAHEHLVIAEVTAPMGRWLLCGTGCGTGVPPVYGSAGPDPLDLAPARAYERTLLSRAIAIFRRRRHLKRAIAAAESLREIETSGQRRLFT